MQDQHQLWDNIVSQHWEYSETEDNMNKFEKRRRLEERQKEFLSMVKHDRKFYLPVTLQVLRVSMQQMKDFSARKALNGFESISQYANNLFKKPWRVEYRTIKMYSGHYQHAIASNLIDAEKLFIEMGYKLLPNDTLVLEGPICPDQVSNVSRDAMMAYVECQIMNEIYCGLIKRQISISWLAIFDYREKHVGDALSAIEDICFKRQQQQQQCIRGKAINENGYNLNSTAIYSNCLSKQHHQMNNNVINNNNQSNNNNNYYQHNRCQHQQPQQQPQPCFNNVNHSNAVPSCSYAVAAAAASAGPSMSHSKSLEYYNEIESAHQRHQQHIYNPYCDTNRQTVHSMQAPPPPPPPPPQTSGDYVDGGCHNCLAANRFYNIAGSRCALPYNVSNHIGPATGLNRSAVDGPPCSIYAGQNSAATHDCCHTKQYEYTTNHIDYGGHGAMQQQPDQHCADCENPSRSMPAPRCVMTENYGSVESAAASQLPHQPLSAYHNMMNGRSSNYTDHRLIDVEDRAAGAYGNGYFDRKMYSMPGGESIGNHHINNHESASYVKHVPKHSYHVDPPAPLYGCRKTQNDLNQMDNNHVYSSGAGLERKRNYGYDKYRTNAEIISKYTNHINNENDSRTSRESDFNSYEDLDYEAVQPAAPRKRDNGHGSHETWDYVYKQLGNKDPDVDDIDLCVQGLDLNSSATNAYADIGKRSNRTSENCARNYTGAVYATTDSIPTKSKSTLDQHSNSNSKLNGKCGKSDRQPQQHPHSQKQQQHQPQQQQQQQQQQQNDQRMTPKINIQNSENIKTNNSFSTIRTKEKKELPTLSSLSSAVSLASTSATATASKSISSTTPSVVGQSTKQPPAPPIRNRSIPVDPPTVPDDWSCRFCTFINEASVRICAICAKSKDFDLGMPTANKKSTTSPKKIKTNNLLKK